MIHQRTACVLHAERLSGDMVLLVLDAPEVASEARPGQFVMVRCDAFTLRRPLSVHLAGDGRIALLFRVTGSGTAWLSSLEAGAEIDLTGPLGNGYAMPAAGGDTMLIAGGMGIAPLVFLAAELPEPGSATLVYGARSQDEIYRVPAALRSLMPRVARVDEIETLLVTDDGSAGMRGSALDVALPLLHRVQAVYLCGPVGMCVGASQMMTGEYDITRHAQSPACSPLGRERLASAQVSLEVRMACGVGACYGCSIATRQGRRKVCVDGPVFTFGDVCWEEVVT